jgi:hypothetical protein
MEQNVSPPKAQADNSCNSNSIHHFLMRSTDYRILWSRGHRVSLSVTAKAFLARAIAKPPHFFLSYVFTPSFSRSPA